jgi:predicted anti-sigma-YlaC factor YlaD
MLNPYERADFAMRCSKARKWISRQLDGELDGDQTASLAAHLADCEACRAHADQLGCLDLDLLEPPEPTAGFVADVLERLDESPAQRRAVLSRPALFRPIAAGLGIAASLIGFAVGSLFDGTNAIEVPPSSDSVELVASAAIDPLATDSIESVLLAMLSDTEE